MKDPFTRVGTELRVFTLMITILLMSCTPEEIISYRDSENPGDPSIAKRPVNSIVGSRLYGSNFRQSTIDRFGFFGNGHAQSWDGRLFVSSRHFSGSQGWFIQVFRPENMTRDPDGSPNFNEGSGVPAFSPVDTGAGLLLDFDDRFEVGMNSEFLNALAIVPHPNPSNASLTADPSFTYDIHKNPFSSDANGNYLPGGAFETYELLVYATKYIVGTNLNRTVSMDVRVVVSDPKTSFADIHSTEIVRAAQELADETGSPIYGIEPSVTFDGRLMVFNDNVVPPSKVKYTYNEDPESLTGWSTPRSIVDAHHVDREVMVAGEQFQTRYPISRRKLKDHLGVEYAQGDIVYGAYPWISLDGTEIAYTAAQSSDFTTRGGFTINGFATHYQARHVDGPINDYRDAPGDRPNAPFRRILFVSSPGAVPSFWFPFVDELNGGMPLPYSTVKPVIPFYQSNRGEYFEVPLEDSIDGRYLSVLRMNEGIDRAREYLSRITPDTSGYKAHGHFVGQAAFPVEAGLADVPIDPSFGRSVLFGADDYLRIDDNSVFDRISRAFSVELFVMRRAALTDVFVPLAARTDAFSFLIAYGDYLVGRVYVTDGAIRTPYTIVLQLDSFDLNVFTHVAMTAGIDDDDVLTLKLFQDGELLGTPVVEALGIGERPLPVPIPPGVGNDPVFRTSRAVNRELVENDEPIFIGPKGATNLVTNALVMDDVKLSHVERDQQHIRESAYRNGVVDSSFDVASIPAGEIGLGQMLFSDVRLSGDGSMSCATCHDPALSFTDGVATPVVGGTRNTPTLIGRAHTTKQFWDGRADNLEEQSLLPVLNPAEMNNTELGLLRVLNDHYADEFGAVFGNVPSLELTSLALASFVRSISGPSTAFDDFKEGNPFALTASEQRGMQLFFNKARCSACHNGPNFSDELFHNTGFVNLISVPELDVGRSGGRFKTPTLRAIQHTGPYLHDGSLGTLEEVVDLYNDGGIGIAGGPDIEIKKLELTPEEKTDLVNFLRTL